MTASGLNTRHVPTRRNSILAFENYTNEHTTHRNDAAFSTVSSAMQRAPVGEHGMRAPFGT